ncbi:MAG: quinolinate synthase NadA [Rikenellaceae bacterium]|nr:quinolinate synthase NadA [Rikenellaceae bacterium]MBR2443546.1 quinolinate synthase NadA [Rikenellaceae bacterium]
MEQQELIEKITLLKQQKKAIILAHYYTRGEVQQVADFVGDSLALAVEAQKTDAEIILFAGVRFMGETAKVLCPSRKVLLPVPEADCSLAQSCSAEQLREFKAQYPDALVVSYVNTNAEVKALTDICCTSGNALKVVESIPPTRDIIFAPDHNLGTFIELRTGRKMIKWKGCCHVHDKVTPEQIALLKKQHPEAKVLVHPECRPEVVALADVAGSTADILKACGGKDKEYIVVTENGILWELQRRFPDKTFYPIALECEYMKMLTLENIYKTLRTESPVVEVADEVADAARQSIERMINC